ncbi:MAG TPA: hypothetical protein VG267_10565 [Terracidiphilus sp.]|nr:hypothetical protein [Terracidiphilus sp.]
MSLKPPTFNSESELSQEDAESLKPPTVEFEVSVEESVEISSAGEVADGSLKPPTAF